MLWTIEPLDMRRMEQAFIKNTGVPGLLLMEHASLALQPFLMDAERVLFVCGPGNNGGDGLAAARQFAQQGGEAIVWLTAAPDTLMGDARANAQMLEGLGIGIEVLKEGVPDVPAVDWIVDALFGTGLDRPLTGIYTSLIEGMNASGHDILAVDIPSGIDGRSGQVLGCAIQATRTVTFHRPKPGHYFYPGRTHAGALTVAPIGIPHAWDDAPGLSVLQDSDVRGLLPRRRPDAHKGSNGHVLCVAGAWGMAGAAALCAQAALRGGAGLVTLACPDALVDTVQRLAPCAMAMPVDDAQALEKALAGKTCAVVGPGLSRAPECWARLAPLFTVDIPQVWDADALNLLAEHQARPPRHTIVTPHPGEASRLLGWPIEQITQAPLEAARALSAQLEAVVLLKGATTVIVHGSEGALNISGCAGMATGGSGDVLAGLIGALLAQGMSGYDAACLGAFLHGRAGERAAQALGVPGMTAWDLPDRLMPAPEEHWLHEADETPTY